MPHWSDDDPFSDEDYHRVQAGGWTQRDQVLAIWRENNPRHEPLPDEPSLADNYYAERAARAVEATGDMEQSSETFNDAKRAGVPDVPQEKDWSWRDAPRKARPAQSALSAAAIPREHQKLCKCGCGTPIPPGAPKNQQYVARHRWRTAKRKQRERDKARDHERRQMLGLEPIPPAPEPMPWDE